MTDNTYDFIDSWRPSRVRAITKGELYWTEVDIVDISDIPTAMAIRYALEPFGIKVNYFPIGLSTHLKKVLSKDGLARAPYLIVAAHGDEKDGDLSFGQKLGEQLAATQDFYDKITPEDLTTFIDVTGKIVINTACGSGESRLADVFVKQGGAKSYIADTLAPFGYTSTLFPVLIFYFLTNYPKLSIEQAFERAKTADVDEFKTWKLVNLSTAAKSQE